MTAVDGHREPRLRGVRLSEMGPIGTAYIELAPGVMVLYGRNGVGKSSVLQGIKAAFEGRPMSGRAELHFECSPEGWQDVDPVSPWVALQEPSEHGLEHPAEHASELAEYRARMLKLCESRNVAGLYITYVAEVACNVARDQLAGRESESAVLEVVLQSRFARIATPDGVRVGIVGVADDSSPSLVRVWQDAYEHTDDMSSDDLRTTVTKGEGPDLVAADGFLGYFNMRSTTYKRYYGVAPPNWCGDIWGATTWGDWPAPVLDPDNRVDLVELSLRSLIHYQKRAEHPRNMRRLEMGSVPQFVNDPGALFDITNRMTAGAWQSSVGPRLDSLHAATDVADLLDSAPSGESVKSNVIELARTLGETASDRFGRLLDGASPLVCEILPISQWHNVGVVRWMAIDPTGRLVSFDKLSDAQRRWANFAVRLTLGEVHGERPPIIVIDEPERGLHRRAERHLSVGLRQIAEQLRAVVVVVTHSPAMLSLPSAKLHHVARDAEGATVVHRFPESLRPRAQELGLDPADLLQLVRSVLLVEGEHEQWILDQLFGQEFESTGVKMFTMRGARNLKNAADAELLFQFSDARVVAMVDNLDPRHVADVWHRARQAKAAGSDYFTILDELKDGPHEAQFLRSFCAEVLKSSQSPDRFEVWALSKRDVLEYLPAASIIRGLKDGMTWSDLHEDHERYKSTVRKSKPKKFKEFLVASWKADLSEESVRKAAADLGHPDFTNLMVKLTHLN